jgi:hypothetical protein
MKASATLEPRGIMELAGELDDRWFVVGPG